MQPSPKKPRSDPALTDLLRNGVAIVDVRAPVEYAQGHLPSSKNLPILNDDERAKVGTLYKAQGNDAATKLGHKLVSGDTKAARIAAWQAFAQQHQDCRVMCWRGGQRSKTAQAWLAQSGLDMPTIDGGYKAVRHACLTHLADSAASDKPWWVVAGRTGSQKTVLIQALAASIDLEKLAHHRGSAFGAYPTPQPSVPTFENALAVTSLQHDHQILILEDESRTIGRVGLPPEWHARMQQAPLALIETTIETRTAHIAAEYVDEALASGQSAEELHQHYLNALRKISRRLGGALHQELVELLRMAFAGEGSHEAWVHALLSKYYDPMYDYQLAKKQARIKYRGTREEVTEFLDHKANQP